MTSTESKDATPTKQVLPRNLTGATPKLSTSEESKLRDALLEESASEQSTSTTYISKEESLVIKSVSPGIISAESVQTKSKSTCDELKVSMKSQSRGAIPKVITSVPRISTESVPMWSLPPKSIPEEFGLSQCEAEEETPKTIMLGRPIVKTAPNDTLSTSRFIRRLNHKMKPIEETRLAPVSQVSLQRAETVTPSQIVKPVARCVYKDSPILVSSAQNDRLEDYTLNAIFSGRTGQKCTLGGIIAEIIKILLREKVVEGIVGPQLLPTEKIAEELALFEIPSVAGPKDSSPLNSISLKSLIEFTLIELQLGVSLETKAEDFALIGERLVTSRLLKALSGLTTVSPAETGGIGLISSMPEAPTLEELGLKELMPTPSQYSSERPLSTAEFSPGGSSSVLFPRETEEENALIPSVPAVGEAQSKFLMTSSTLSHTYSTSFVERETMIDHFGIRSMPENFLAMQHAQSPLAPLVATQNDIIEHQFPSIFRMSTPCASDESQASGNVQRNRVDDGLAIHIIRKKTMGGMVRRCIHEWLAWNGEEATERSILAPQKPVSAGAAAIDNAPGQEVQNASTQIRSECRSDIDTDDGARRPISGGSVPECESAGVFPRENEEEYALIRSSPAVEEAKSEFFMTSSTLRHTYSTSVIERETMIDNFGTMASMGGNVLATQYAQSPLAPLVATPNDNIENPFPPIVRKLTPSTSDESQAGGNVQRNLVDDGLATHMIEDRQTKEGMAGSSIQGCPAWNGEEASERSENETQRPISAEAVSIGYAPGQEVQNASTQKRSQCRIDIAIDDEARRSVSGGPVSEYVLENSNLKADTPISYSQSRPELCDLEQSGNISREPKWRVNMPCEDGRSIYQWNKKTQSGRRRNSGLRDEMLSSHQTNSQCTSTRSYSRRGRTMGGGQRRPRASSQELSWRQETSTEDAPVTAPIRENWRDELQRCNELEDQVSTDELPIGSSLKSFDPREFASVEYPTRGVHKRGNFWRRWKIRNCRYIPQHYSLSVLPMVPPQAPTPVSGQASPSGSKQSPPPVAWQMPPPESWQDPPQITRQGPPPEFWQGPPPMYMQAQSPGSRQGPLPMSLQAQSPGSRQGPPPMSLQTKSPGSRQGPLPMSLQAQSPGSRQGPPPMSLQAQSPGSRQGPPPMSLQAQSPGSRQGPPPMSLQSQSPGSRQGPLPMSLQAQSPGSRQVPPSVSGQVPLQVSLLGAPLVMKQRPSPMSHQGPPPVSRQGPSSWSRQAPTPMSRQGPLPVAEQRPPLLPLPLAPRVPLPHGSHMSGQPISPQEYMTQFYRTRSPMYNVW